LPIWSSLSVCTRCRCFFTSDKRRYAYLQRPPRYAPQSGISYATQLPERALTVAIRPPLGDAFAASNVIGTNRALVAASASLPLALPLPTAARRFPPAWPYSMVSLALCRDRLGRSGICFREGNRRSDIGISLMKGCATIASGHQSRLARPLRLRGLSFWRGAAVRHASLLCVRNSTHAVRINWSAQNRER